MHFFIAIVYSVLNVMFVCVCVCVCVCARACVCDITLSSN